MTPGDVEATLRAPNGLHLLPVLTLGLTLLDPQFLKEDIGRVKDATRVARVGALVAHEASQLGRLDLAGLLVCVVLGQQVTTELGASDARSAQVSGDFTPHLITGVVDLDGIVLLALCTVRWG